MVLVGFGCGDEFLIPAAHDDAGAAIKQAKQQQFWNATTTMMMMTQLSTSRPLLQNLVLYAAIVVLINYVMQCYINLLTFR